MKVLLTAGTWDLNGGKKSGLIEKMYQKLNNYNDFEIDYYNGGNYENLDELIKSAKNYEIIFWMANVPNDLPKARYIKTINPFALVIGSKRNHYDYNKNEMEYTFVEILNKALEQRNNLTIEFSKLKDTNKFKMLLFDPLGTSWYNGYDLDELVENMVNRIRFIMTTKRERTYEIRNNKSKLMNINNDYSIPNNEDFFQYVRDVAEIFHKTIEHADGVTRFLGNASFKYNNKIFVTRRDVDKALINRENFVESYLEYDKVYYYGTNKPSKDTVVQTRLYKMLPNVNYIVHSHCYAENGYFTNTPVPCGALDEIDEVLYVIKKYYNNDFSLNYYKINLKGHGCLILGNSLDEMKQTKYVTRHLPEVLDKEFSNIYVKA